MRRQLFGIAWIAVALALGPLACANSAAAAPATLFGSAVPATIDSGDSNPVELGVKFNSEVAGNVTGIRFYKASANTGKHIGSLWSASGKLLASATFSGETASGWQQVSFSTPVPIAANTIYIAAYLAPKGHYSDTSSGYASAGFSNSPLSAVANSLSANGVYAYSATSVFPTSTYKATNYWVDVEFEAAAALAPPGQATNVSATAGNGSATVTWSAPANGGPASKYTITPYIGNEAQTSTVVGGSATKASVAKLTNGTTYTFTVTAANAAGTGPVSEQSNAVTPSTRPSAPSGVTAIAENASATVTWNAPSNGGSPITGYTVTPYIAGEAQASITVGGSPPATKVSVTGLTNGATYTFTVTATNAAGNGPVSEQSNAVTPTAGTASNPFLIGENTAFSKYHVIQNGGAILAWPFTATNSGTIEALHIYVLSLTAAINGVELGVYENHMYSFAEPFSAYGEESSFWQESGLAPESPGTLLAAKYVATGGHPQSKWVEIPGFDVKVTKGTQYWLAVVAHANANGQDLVYGKKNTGEAKPWGNYSNEWGGPEARTMETLPPPPAVKEMKEPVPGWQQEEPAGYEFQLGREAQEEGGPPSLYATGSESEPESGSSENG